MKSSAYFRAEGSAIKPASVRTVVTPELLSKRILVAEDQPLVALDLEMTLTAAGATLVGPFAEVDEGLKAASEKRIDAAILDVDLAGADVFPLAYALRARGIPFVFHTGRSDIVNLRNRFPDALIFTKPGDIDDLVEEVAKLLG